ncbi:hypothetical protein Tco_0644349 [Tanacetum coccineum]
MGFRNKKDERGIVIKEINRDWLHKGVTPRRRDGIMMKFLPLSLNEAIRLFLAYASFIGLYGLPVGSTQSRKMLVMDSASSSSQLRYEPINLICGTMGSERKDRLDCVYQKEQGDIFQDKYVTEILKKFGFTDVKTASTPMETQKPLLKDKDVCACARYHVNQCAHLYAVKTYTDNDYAGASLDKKSTTGGCQFLGCRLISWQCKKQTMVANSTTEAEYVAASSCCGQVLWIQNQLLDYGGLYTNGYWIGMEKCYGWNLLVSAGEEL